MCDADGMLMGTTASMLYFQKRAYTLCNIGDSPVFRYRHGQLTQIHQEHTERATYESVTGKKAEPGKKFRLTQNIGIFPDEITIEPYCAVGDLKPGDIYLICSDGITDMVSSAQIIETLNAQPTAADIAQSLEEQALAAGGKDNATIICIRVLRSLWGR
jgi:protein phosphatase